MTLPEIQESWRACLARFGVAVKKWRDAGSPADRRPYIVGHEVVEP